MQNIDVKETRMSNTAPNATRTVHVGLIGLGTVGGGVARTITRHRDKYRTEYGIDVQLSKVCALDRTQAAALGLEDAFVSDWHEVVSDPAIDVVVELIGGEHPALEIFEAAFAAGKHMVTANKALLGRNMERICTLAAQAGVQLRCEASSGGGIPIVNALEHALHGNEMLTVAGILNGTTNYILSRMTAEGLGFEEVLADAQRLGYAEADPTADVDGFDAASKVAILSSIAFSTRVTTDDVYMQGIRNVSALDIEQARALGYTVKLLGIARKTADGIDARVHPTMIPSDHVLAGVSGAMNAVYAVGDAVGETMFYGAGAGSFPTASAVVGDILELADPIVHGSTPMPEPAPFARTMPIRPMADLETKYYLRLTIADEADTLGVVAAVIGGHQIPMDSLTRVAGDEDGLCSIIILTDTARESDVSAACAELEALDGAQGAISVIRIEDTSAWTLGVEEN